MLPAVKAGSALILDCLFTLTFSLPDSGCYCDHGNIM